jgi:lipopolysaccharide export LptBFGC system permease protein LptF
MNETEFEEFEEVSTLNKTKDDKNKNTKNTSLFSYLKELFISPFLMAFSASLGMTFGFFFY